MIHPEFLALYLNSPTGKLQVQQKTSGGVQMNLTIPAIESILVTLGDLNWQMSFVRLVEESLSARSSAKRMLEMARRTVEIAIEHNEITAQNSRSRRSLTRTTQ